MIRHSPKNVDAHKIIELLSQDNHLRPLIQQCTLDIMSNGLTVFETLVKSIVSQQLSTKVAKVIYERCHYKWSNVSPKTVLNTPYDMLRQAGLSQQKTTYIYNTAQYFSDSKLKEEDWYHMQDDEIIEHLIQIKGIGRWTVQMMLMFCMGRMDVFAVDDLVIRTKMISLYELKTSGKILQKNLDEIAEGWRPYRSIACRYLWAGKDLK